MSNLIACHTPEQLPDTLKGSSIEKLIEYHNCKVPLGFYSSAEMVIVTCMDNRLKYRVPDNFAYFIRTGGARVDGFEFHISFAISKGAKSVAVIGHEDCGMAKVSPEPITDVLCSQGWSEALAGKFAEEGMNKFSIDSVPAFTLKQVDILKSVFPDIIIAPLLYSFEDHKLSFISAD